MAKSLYINVVKKTAIMTAPDSIEIKLTNGEEKDFETLFRILEKAVDNGWYILHEYQEGSKKNG